MRRLVPLVSLLLVLSMSSGFALLCAAFCSEPASAASASAHDCCPEKRANPVAEGFSAQAPEPCPVMAAWGERAELAAPASVPKAPAKPMLLASASRDLRTLQLTFTRAAQVPPLAPSAMPSSFPRPLVLRL